VYFLSLLKRRLKEFKKILAFFIKYFSHLQQKHGPRMKCSACKIIAHASCITLLMDRQQLACKPTFRDVGVRQYREQTKTHHHWIHRRTEKGKCKQCGKVSKEIVKVMILLWDLFVNGRSSKQ
jgi:hypothetical protein